MHPSLAFNVTVLSTCGPLARGNGLLYPAYPAVVSYPSTMCCNGFRGSRLTRMSRVTCPLDKRLYAQEGKRARGCWHMYTIVSQMTCAASVECILYMCCICCCSMHRVHALKTGCSFNRLAELLFEGALSIVLPVSCRRQEAMLCT
jgi:hypothetical protein